MYYTHQINLKLHKNHKPENHISMKQYTITYLVRAGEMGRNKTVILAEKKDKIGVGKLNGYGGKIDPGEQIWESAIREIKDESGVLVEPGDLEYSATMVFFDKERPVAECHIFIAHRWLGEPVETKEMGVPQEFPISSLPLERMMLGDNLWVPKVLNGMKFSGAMSFDADSTKVLRFETYPPFKFR